MREKPNRKKKEYSALNVHIAPPKMNNLILTTCYTGIFAKPNLYINLMNNFARYGVNVYVSST